MKVINIVKFRAKSLLKVGSGIERTDLGEVGNRLSEVRKIEVVRKMEG